MNDETGDITDWQAVIEFEERIEERAEMSEARSVADEADSDEAKLAAWENKRAELLRMLLEFDFDCGDRPYAQLLIQSMQNTAQAAQEFVENVDLAETFRHRALAHAKCCSLHRSQVEFLQGDSISRRAFYWKRGDGVTVPSVVPSDPYIGERYLKIWQRIKDHYGSAEEGTFEWNIAEHDRDNRERRGHLLEVITREKLVEPPTIFDGLASERRRA